MVDQRPERAMVAAAVLAKRFVLLLAVWLVLTGNAPSAWPVGLLAAAAAAALSLRLLPTQGRAVRLLTVLRLAPGFAWTSLLGGLDVARRAFHPHLPLNPQWRVYRVRLPAGAPRVSLGNALSLMPGTLVAGGGADALYVHCLDGERPIDAQVAAEEKRVADTLGLTLEEADG